MAELQGRRHGLESFLASCPADAGGDAGVEILIQPNFGHINLRGDPGIAEFVSAAESVPGQELPVTPNTMSNGKNRIFWLGPNEWLVITPLADSLELMARLRKSFTGQHACVTDVSGGQIAMQLSGSRVRDVLAKGCTLDFHPDSFKAGSCAQSGIAKANMLIGLVDDEATFEIVMRRSYVEYFALWLRHAAREYRVSFSVG